MSNIIINTGQIERVTGGGGGGTSEIVLFIYHLEVGRTISKTYMTGDSIMRLSSGRWKVVEPFSRLRVEICRKAESCLKENVK
jgi:hypothetical protein